MVEVNYRCGYMEKDGLEQQVKKTQDKTSNVKIHFQFQFYHGTILCRLLKSYTVKFQILSLTVSLFIEYRTVHSL